MSAGIISYGAYVPIYRLSRATLSQVWGGPVLAGEKAVANWDEDSLTMAVEAIIGCLNGTDRESIDSLYFASTSPVYLEKQSASIIAKAIDLRRDIATADLAHSLRGGTIALRAALDAVNAGSAKKAMAVAADCSLTPPHSELELSVGDGSAAFLIGDSDVAVEIEGSLTISSIFMDTWKGTRDRYVRTWEDRFIIQHGYLEHLVEVISMLFQKYNLSPQDFAKAVFPAYDARRHADLAKQLGFTPDQVQDPMLTSVGNTRSASVPMMLTMALEDSKPGDRILLTNYGDGADAFILRVTSNIEKVRRRSGIEKYLASKMTLPNYGRYLHFRDVMEWQPRREPEKYASLTMSWRDQDWVLSCKGNRCRSCEHIMFPPQRVCSWCQVKDNSDEVRLSDKKGTLFTYSLDNLAVNVDPPNVIAIVDLEGGGRFSTTMTDRDIEKIYSDMPVELTFRLVHEGRGIRNYFWKCRPIRA